MADLLNGGSMNPLSLVGVLVFLVACFLGSVRAQTHEKQDEIPIERCDRLPVVTMKVAGENRRFLLDTAATTILNLKSFASGESKQIHIYSWSGSAATSAREVFLPQVELGTHRLRDLKLPAIDLSPIGKTYGGQIDGILGVDLLDQMGMTIDLKRRVAVPAPAGEPEDSADAFAEVKGTWGPAMSRESDSMRYLSQRYFKFAPKLHYEVRPQDLGSFGDLLWYSYDFWIDTPEEHRTGHGMSMCRRDAGGRWRILNMHNSVKEAAAAADPVH